MINNIIYISGDKKLNCLMNLSWRASERCAAISPEKERLIRSTLNDNPSLWIWVLNACLLFLLLILFQTVSYATEADTQGGLCPQTPGSSPECSENSGSNTIFPGLEEKKSDKTFIPQKDSLKDIRKDKGKSSRTLPVSSSGTPGITGTVEKPVLIYFFWGSGCPHCKEEKLFLNEIKKKHPVIEIRDFEVWYEKRNAVLLSKMAAAYNLMTSGVPVTFVGKNVFVGFSEQSRKEIGEAIQKCLADECINPELILSGTPVVIKPESGEISQKTENLECKEKSKTVYIPWVGNLDASEMSLPVITIVIAGLDSFNPCAFFVLFSLLGLLIHARSRKKMFLIGSVFVFFSGFIYFLFMAAWLNLFLVMGQVAIITTIAGAIAILIAVINIKDFFIFKKGVSLTIPDSAKPRLFDRMRKLLKSTSVLSILIGTAVLAIAANSYELLCTAGFPMVFTRIMTLNHLSKFSYYVYLLLYNFIYVIPLAIIVVLFTITLGKKVLTEWQGRVLKLVSGTMMLGLGGVLVIDPSVLSNAFISLVLLLGALSVSVIVAFLFKAK